MATEDDVRRICLALPGVSERPSWKQPAWFARTLVARIWEDGVLTVKTGERDALLASDPGVYYITPHHERSPNLVLVRLARIGPGEVSELIEESYRIAEGSYPFPTWRGKLTAG
ncbi:MmcQ/YjbR family DNA-binding protein [Arthrobacter sp. Br18]|uniref:MmcQ/YjbR family DNA-binding protein n=1 Tax=Arthrobacter sp. Br18 TaxID=1312954 RepID=UPI0004B1C14A|nr:MmcQ/YjbR family DNA-binding protein [Arthrobacter sp. Br18]